MPGSGKSSGGGNGSPLQHSCLGNPMDGGAWRAAAHGVAKSWTSATKQQQCKQSTVNHTHGTEQEALIGGGVTTEDLREDGHAWDHSQPRTVPTEHWSQKYYRERLLKRRLRAPLPRGPGSVNSDISQTSPRKVILTEVVFRQLLDKQHGRSVCKSHTVCTANLEVPLSTQSPRLHPEGQNSV